MYNLWKSSAPNKLQMILTKDQSVLIVFRMNIYNREQIEAFQTDNIAVK